MKNLQNQTTILLIENNSDWLADTYSVLQKAGYDVLIATGGDEGFCLARRIRPDLILCETALPDISGIQLCYMIRADKQLHSSLFILMGNANGQDSDTAFEGFCAGADDYMESNCSPKFLAAKITRLLALQRIESELRQSCKNLRSSERHLTKIIEDASNMVTALDSTFRCAVLDKPDISKPGKFFTKSDDSKKPGQKNRTADLENWRQALQPKQVIDAGKYGNVKREKVYYEIVC